ncbi:hypothetical protein LBMAG57_00870 [Verrucomicrobiota bacterium]|nr:hypothetical protein LBMAG57_00870 [Verrucomicrobiota bacterium]
MGGAERDGQARACRERRKSGADNLWARFLFPCSWFTWTETSAKTAGTRMKKKFTTDYTDGLQRRMLSSVPSV